MFKRKTKEDDVKAIFGKGGSVYTNSKSALRTFGFIENDSLELTDKGRRVVYSEEVDRKKEIQKVLVSYPPYSNAVGNPHITINVDMGDWNEKK